MRIFFLVSVAALAAPSWAIVQSEGETPATRPASMPRDRYTASRPITVERFRSVFRAYDMNSDGKLTRAEAKAGGMSESRFAEYDLNRNGTIDVEEFELAYGLCLRRRGQAVEPAVQERIAELEKLAPQRGWRLPEAKEGDSPKPPKDEEGKGAGGAEPPLEVPVVTPPPGFEPLRRDRYSPSKPDTPGSRNPPAPTPRPTPRPDPRIPPAPPPTGGSKPAARR